MDAASALIPVAILLVAACLLMAGFITLRSSGPPLEAAGGASAGTVPVRLICPGTGMLTRLRIRPERRGSLLGLSVVECERFPDRVPGCDQECVDPSAALTRSFAAEEM